MTKKKFKLDEDRVETLKELLKRADTARDQLEEARSELQELIDEVHDELGQEEREEEADWAYELDEVPDYRSVVEDLPGVPNLKQKT